MQLSPALQRRNALARFANGQAHTPDGLAALQATLQLQQLKHGSKCYAHNHHQSVWTAEAACSMIQCRPHEYKLTLEKGEGALVGVGAGEVRVRVVVGGVGEGEEGEAWAGMGKMAGMAAVAVSVGVVEGWVDLVEVCSRHTDMEQWQV